VDSDTHKSLDDCQPDSQGEQGLPDSDANGLARRSRDERRGSTSSSPRDAAAIRGRRGSRPGGIDEEPGALRKIIVGVDGSPGATEALRFALEEAEVIGGLVVALSAWQIPPGAYGGPESVALAHELFKKEGQSHLERCLESSGAAQSAVAVEPRLVKGDARHVLCRAANSADMLVVGSRGLGAVRSLLLGSVSMYCVHHAACPVVIVPPRRRDGEQASR
jgi:nucleotide-binding universal stress UspA family protein